MMLRPFFKKILNSDMKIGPGIVALFITQFFFANCRNQPSGPAKNFDSSQSIISVRDTISGHSDKRRLNTDDMSIEKLPKDFHYLEDMYKDDYFPDKLVDKVKLAIENVVKFIEEGGHTTTEIQKAFDKMTITINGLQDEFERAGSEIETGARESIGETVMKILEYFRIDIDVEEAIRERDW
jgi:hypothetical protein